MPNRPWPRKEYKLEKANRFGDFLKALRFEFDASGGFLRHRAKKRALISIAEEHDMRWSVFKQRAEGHNVTMTHRVDAPRPTTPDGLKHVVTIETSDDRNETLSDLVAAMKAFGGRFDYTFDPVWSPR